jgi:cytochrome P450
MVRTIAADSKVTETTSQDEKHAPGTIDVGNVSSRATLDIIGLSGMGQDFNSLAIADNKLSQTYANVLKVDRSSWLSTFLQLAPIFLPNWFLVALPIQRNADLNAATTYIKQTCRDLIATKRKKLDTEKAAGGEAKISRDILTVALQSNAFDDENLVNQLMTFLVAGHETTATAMMWALYALCKYPNVQTRLREEIRKSIDSLDSDITAQDIDDCHYLQAFCSEVLRLWPPVNLTLRVAERDTVIQGQAIPKGTTVLLVPVAVNVSEELWGKDVSTHPHCTC